MVVAVSGAVFCEPVAGIVPVQVPEAAQLLALVEDQVKVDKPPFETVVGLAVSLTVGAGAVFFATVSDTLTVT